MSLNMEVWPLNIHNKVITEASWHIQIILLHKSFSGPQACYPLQSNGVLLALLCLWPVLSSLPPLLVLLSPSLCIELSLIKLHQHLQPHEAVGGQWPAEELEELLTCFLTTFKENIFFLCCDSNSFCLLPHLSLFSVPYSVCSYIKGNRHTRVFH